MLLLLPLLLLPMPWDFHGEFSKTDRVEDDRLVLLLGLTVLESIDVTREATLLGIGAAAATVCLGSSKQAARSSTDDFFVAVTAMAVSSDLFK